MPNTPADNLSSETHDVPLVDIDQCLRITKGKATLAKDMFVMLINSLDESAAMIKATFQASNYVELQELVHQLRGGSSYCGVPRLTNMSAELEKRIQKQHYAGLGDIIDKLLQTMTDVKIWAEKNDIGEQFNQHLSLHAE